MTAGKSKKGGGRGRRLLGAVGLAGLAAAGAFGASLFLRKRHNAGGAEDDARGLRRDRGGDRWARPGMVVTFRAELMPGRSRAERTYRVAQLLTGNRVTLEEAAGEHSETEFEPLR